MNLRFFITLDVELNQLKYLCLGFFFFFLGWACKFSISIFWNEEMHFIHSSSFFSIDSCEIFLFKVEGRGDAFTVFWCSRLRPPTGMAPSSLGAAAANPVLVFLVQVWRVSPGWEQGWRQGLQGACRGPARLGANPAAWSSAPWFSTAWSSAGYHSWIEESLLCMEPWEMPSPAAGQGLPPEQEQTSVSHPPGLTAPAEPPHSCCHCSSVPKWGILLFKTAEHPEILTHHSGSCGISGLENEVICLFSWNSISGAGFEMLVWNSFLSPWMCLNCSSIKDLWNSSLVSWQQSCPEHCVNLPVGCSSGRKSRYAVK